MISFLTGIPRDETTVMTGGVGYTVHSPDPLPVGEPVELYIHSIISETAFDLYGFGSAPVREMFRLLIRANGVGPKVAMAALRELGAGVCARAVHSEDTATLVRVPGIGPKGAKAMVGQITVPDALLAVLCADEDLSVTGAPVDREDPLVGGLVGLGWTPPAAAAAAARARSELGEDAEEAQLLRWALSSLSPAR